jgi:hypothetical protein
MIHLNAGIKPLELFLKSGQYFGQVALVPNRDRVGDQNWFLNDDDVTGHQAPRSEHAETVDCGRPKTVYRYVTFYSVVDPDRELSGLVGSGFRIIWG